MHSAGWKFHFLATMISRMQSNPALSSEGYLQHLHSFVLVIFCHFECVLWIRIQLLVLSRHGINFLLQYHISNMNHLLRLYLTPTFSIDLDAFTNQSSFPFV